MKDRALEALYYPVNALKLELVRAVVCLAPHPDDEVIGCGGLLSLLASHQIDVFTIIVTGGQAQAQSGRDREGESREAATVLGVQHPEFWRYQDRTLSARPELVSRIASVLCDRQPSHLLVTALSEPHPDHQALALAACRAAIQSGLHDLTLVFYEVGAPMVPNTRVDISAVVERKWQAFRCFESQQAVYPYLQIAQAMARLRAQGLSGDVTAAEAFYCITTRDLSEKGHGIAVPTISATRRRLALAQGVDDLPLVSVLVRSTGRASLFETLQSITNQHYPNLECVLVCAHGRAHPPDQLPEHLLIREVFGPKQESLGRAQAANQALLSARGDYCLYLDDDDLIDPDHLSRLVSALQSQTTAPAAYAGVRVETGEGQLIRNYDSPWSFEKLQALNFLPIHAVLFRRVVVLELGLQFREDLPVLEDWDFWRHLAKVGSFIHVPGVSASYRKLDLGSGVSHDGQNSWKVWQLKLLSEFATTATPIEQASLLAWHAGSLDASEQTTLLLQNQVVAVRLEFAVLQQQIAALSEDRERLRSGFEQQIAALSEDRERLRSGFEQQIAAALTDRDALNHSLEEALASLNRIINSRFWRWTSPLRRYFGG